ncbi:hypothetical protein Cgig2_010872 [Carnegiea gigantea]|uniref:BTB/POZ domain-containing protein n=1 Tax=Carnegiea gigantea TaxID=171969 RepID=A0A9Q1JP40_9CARY|nr:hypothetical protein Cgig2_010872 [Carnegiea gigantea]
MNGFGDHLGVVETIFEEETDDLQSLSSAPLSSCSSPLQSCVDAWTAATGRRPDVKILVQGTCFHLHKEPLISKSSYLKRQLIGVSEFTLSPPLKITPDTFKQIADFCYSGHAVITPLNVAALRTAAELLKIDGGDEDGDSLRHRTESYFSMVVAPNRDFVCSVFRSCLPLLPEAEQTAFLASRCIEALFYLEDDDGSDDGGDGVVGCAEELKTVSPEDFKVIVDSMQRRCTRSHDPLYRVVDLYFLISEDQKTQICSTIDCSILSSSLLMHAVQNPHMPLRFIVQAMLIEQLNTHRSIFTALNSAAATTTTTQLRPTHPTDQSPATLGAILERDAALRQVAQLRADIDTTSSKIQTLETELSGMKKLLGAGEVEKEQGRGRSSSCRFSTNNVNKVARGERGSMSFSSGTGYRDQRVVENDRNQSGAKRSLRQRFIRGLKMAFGVSLSKKDEKMDEGEAKGVV